MTVSSLENKVIYTAGGGTTFAYPFRIFEESHLYVYVDDVLVTNYTVTGVGEAGGGNVVFTVAPTVGAEILIIRVVPLIQDIDYVEHDAFPAETHERGLDTGIMIAQQIQEKVDRSLKAPLASGLSDIEVPVEAGKALRWKADESGIECFTVDTSDTLNVITTEGDLIRGGTSGIPERLAAGAAGSLLKMGTTKPEWGSSIVIPLATTLVNRTGVTLSTGNIVFQDVDNDSSVVCASATTVTGIPRRVFVAAETIVNGASGLFYVSGKCTISMYNTVGRGQFIRTATGVSAPRYGESCAEDINGAFAIALDAKATGGMGTVTALLLGHTVFAPRYKIRDIADTLIVKNNVTTPTYKLDVTADVIMPRTSFGYPLRATTVNLTVDITVSGAGGLDTGSEAASTWYYLWYIHNGVDGKLLLSVSSTSPTLPSGYLYRALIGAVYNDASSNFLNFYQTGEHVGREELQILNNGTSTAGAALTVTAAYPANAKKFGGRLAANYVSASTTCYVYNYPVADAIMKNTQAIRSPAAAGNNVCNYTLSTATPYYKVVAGANLDVFVSWWEYEV